MLDIDVDKPDKKLIIMYLTELYNYLEGSKAKEREVCTNRNWILDNGKRFHFPHMGLALLATGPD